MSDRDNVVERRCSYDLVPVPPRRRAYCCERCRRAAANWRRRDARRAR